MVIFECMKRAYIYKAVEYTVTSDERGEACIQAIEVRINVLENVENPGTVMINVNLLTTGIEFPPRCVEEGLSSSVLENLWEIEDCVKKLFII